MFKRIPWTWVIVALIGLLMAGGWWFTPWINQHLSVEVGRTDKEIGAVGDIFGSINALFSGLAFLGLIVTIILQKRELKANTDALKGQENELKQQQEALNKQVLLMAHQARLSTAMSMLTVLQKAAIQHQVDLNDFGERNVGPFKKFTGVTAVTLSTGEFSLKTLKRVQEWQKSVLPHIPKGELRDSFDGSADHIAEVVNTIVSLHRDLDSSYSAISKLLI